MTFYVNYSIIICSTTINIGHVPERMVTLMLPILENLQQTSAEAQKISNTLKQFFDTLNHTPSSEEAEVLYDFLKSCQKKVQDEPSLFVNMAADVQELLLELDNALSSGKGRFEISQKVLCYSTIFDNLYHRLENIILVLGN